MSNTEKKPRQIMKGKCFRCGSSDHFANNSSLAKDIICKKCSVQGHIAAACVSGGSSSAPAKANATGEGEAKDSLLPLEYRPAENEKKYAKARALGGGGGYNNPPQPIPFSGRNHYDNNNSAENCAVTQNTDCNRPTPNMLLGLGPARENERGVLVSVTPDSGTTQTILHEKLDLTAGVKIRRTGTDISNASGGWLTVVGEADIRITFKKKVRK